MDAKNSEFCELVRNGQKGQKDKKVLRARNFLIASILEKSFAHAVIYIIQPERMHAGKEYGSMAAVWPTALSGKKFRDVNKQHVTLTQTQREGNSVGRRT